MSGNVAIIGDIHGCIRALDGALNAIPEACNTVVFVGDYVNRGPESKAVLERLSNLNNEGMTYIFLRGNHDAAFIDCLDSGCLREFLLMGGAATIRSYVGEPQPDVLSQLRNAVPGHHARFLRRLDSVFLHGELIVGHDEALLTQKLGSRYRIGRFAVVGHTIQATEAPTLESHIARIDTGCGTLPDGKLCCLIWPSKTWMLVSADGETTAWQSIDDLT